MANELKGKRVAFLFTEGAEQAEVTEPLKAVREAGADVDIVSLEKGEVEMWQHFDKGEKIKADKAVKDAKASDYDGLVLPGGVANPDKLRLVPEAIAFVKGIAAAGKPIAAICHGPWILIEADVVAGKSLTSWPSLETDISNAGGVWRDEQVLLCSAMGFPLVTSRKPDDLPAFNNQLVKTFAQAA